MFSRYYYYHTDLWVGMLDVVLKHVWVEGNVKVGVAQRPDSPRRRQHNFLCALLVACHCSGLRHLLHQFLGFFRLQFFRRSRASSCPASGSSGSITVTLALLCLLRTLTLQTYGLSNNNKWRW